MIYDSLYRLSHVSTIIWAMGELGFQDSLLKFYWENERMKGFFPVDKQEVREQLYEDGFRTYHGLLGTKEDLLYHPWQQDLHP